MEPAGEEGGFGVDAGSVGVGEAAPVGEGSGEHQRRKRAGLLDEQRLVTAEELGGSGRASTRSRTRHSDRSPAAKACLV